MTGRIYDSTRPVAEDLPRPGDLPLGQVLELQPCQLGPGDDSSRTYLVPPEAAGYPRSDRPLVLGLGPAGTSFPHVVGGRAGLAPAGSSGEVADWTQVLIDTGPLSQREAMARLCPPGMAIHGGHHRLCNFVDGATSSRYMIGQALQAPAASSGDPVPSEYAHLPDEPPCTQGTSNGGPDLSALAYCEPTSLSRGFKIPAPQGEPSLVLTSPPTCAFRASAVVPLEGQSPSS